MKTILLTLLFTLSTFGATASLSDYATPDDGLDDSAGIQSAIDDLTDAGGGTLLFTEGTWNINNQVTFVNYDHVGNSFIIRGSKGTIIKPHVSSSLSVFEIGNQNQVALEDLVVVGDGITENVDEGHFLTTASVAQVRMTGCQFFGVRSYTSAIYALAGDVIIKDTLFYGMASGLAVIRAENVRGLTVQDSEFLDYGMLNGTYYSKSAAGNYAWINVSGDDITAKNASGQRAILLQNLLFDEGGYKHVIASNITYMQAIGITANVPAVSEGTAFYLSNVKYAEIKMSKFGYASSPQPAITAVNNSTVYLDGISLGEDVFYGQRDSGSQAFFNLKACTSGCVFAVQ